jgi:hypothetical protein
MKAIKNTPKNGIIWPVKHIFIYEQRVATMSVRIHRKKKGQGSNEKLDC